MIKQLLKLRGPKPCVVAIVTDKDKLYLTKRSKMLLEGGKWCPPGGHIQNGETAKQAAIRELKEESGLNAKSSKFLFYFDEIVPRIGVSNTLLVFKIEVSGKEKTNFEVSDSGWFTRKEIEKMNLAFRYKDVLKKFFDMKKR